MATREVQYAAAAEGYKALVADFQEIFDWDAVEPNEGSSAYTDFKKMCGGDTYVGLRVQQQSSDSPKICAIANNGTNSFVTAQIYSSKNAAFAYGTGFFALSSDTYLLPSASSNLNFAGVSTCRNILTGETSWCAFVRAYINGNSNIKPFDYFLLTKNTKEISNYTITSWNVSFNAKIGAAASLHSPQSGDVSDKIMELTAVPDNYYACIAPVVFNGVRYTRLGSLLVPAD